MKIVFVLCACFNRRLSGHDNFILGKTKHIRVSLKPEVDSSQHKPISVVFIANCHRRWHLVWDIVIIVHTSLYRKLSCCQIYEITCYETSVTRYLLVVCNLLHNKEFYSGFNCSAYY